ncbi:MAG: exodeoxyribonuclease III [Candidatus Tokpelaia sp. JSC161]|nr:MAG: exodeoxyribonuclease III [Candidatus Tokpelaia sp. JSC161]
MKIATWNINGIKARLEHLILWLKENQPDIVCLQEIKSINEKFPRGPIESLGYHVETHGQKGLNGVALLSRDIPNQINHGLPGDPSDHQSRFIEGIYSTKNGIIRIASLYAPNGNPAPGNKFLYKISWMKRLYEFAKNRLLDRDPLILAGDYNVIPTNYDAKNPNKWNKDALALPQTRNIFQRLIQLGFTDAIRALSSSPEYTFWEYQAMAWKKDDGIRIDHLLISPEAFQKLESGFTQKEIRGWEKTSDHVPVWIELNI